MNIHRFGLLLVLLAAAVPADADTTASQIPVAAQSGSTFSGRIDGVLDTDQFSVFLGTGDTLSASVKEAPPQFGLLSTLTLANAQGTDVTPAVKGQASRKASFTFVAPATGAYVMTIVGDPDGFNGSDGNYTASIKVKRVKPPKATFADAAGGGISVPFSAPAGSTVTIAASTKKGGFDLTGLLRPDGTPEPGFAAALRLKARTSATLSKFALTGGAGQYELQGHYDAGSKVTVTAKLVTGERKSGKRLSDDEPRLDPTPVFPTAGIVGTVIYVSGTNFDDIPVLQNGLVVGHRYASFSLGGIEIPAATLTHPNGAIFTFPVPAGLAANQSYDLVVRNADGQGVVTRDAFFLVPPPVALGLSPTEAGPAGGRALRITGADLRRGSSIDFAGTIVQPTFTRPGQYIDVIAPPHAPGNVTLTVRDEFGQTSVVPVQLTYLNIPSNRITSVSPSSFQAAGAQKITVNGADFGTDTVLTYDGVTMNATRVSSSVLEFVTPEHVAGTVKLRVTDQYEQTSAVDVQVKGFTNDTFNAMPTPVATANAVDSWRATRVLVGDVDGDGKKDLVLLRLATAFGNDANRSRIRLLLGDGAGAFTDVTTSKLPAVSGDEDWRAKDGVLADLDGDNDLDLAVVTDSQISGGTRSSLRVLTNNGSGTMTDATSTAVPATTSYGDRNQGVAIAAANVDGANGVDLVILHTNSNDLTEVVVTPGGPPMPPAPPPPDIVTTTYHAGLRVLLNNGSGVFARKANAVPAFTPQSRSLYDGNALAVGDVRGNGRQDVAITRATPIVDPADANNWFVTATLLANDGSGVFTDVTAAQLPAKSDPEYLQGDRLQFADVDGDTKLDLVVNSATRLVSPITSTASTTPATRIFLNNGSGTFSAMSSGTLPAEDADDSFQADGVAVGDLTGDGKADLFLVSAHAPNTGERAGRYLVKSGSAWLTGSKALPDPSAGDDFRGSDAVLVDVDRDGDLDVVLVRDEANDTVRNTLVLRNDR